MKYQEIKIYIEKVKEDVPTARYNSGQLDAMVCSDLQGTKTSVLPGHAQIKNEDPAEKSVDHGVYHTKSKVIKGNASPEYCHQLFCWHEPRN